MTQTWLASPPGESQVIPLAAASLEKEIGVYILPLVALEIVWFDFYIMLGYIKSHWILSYKDSEKSHVLRKVIVGKPPVGSQIGPSFLSLFKL
jgi:hypothetical protein